MIDKNTGHITLNDSLELKPSKDFDTIKNQKLGETQETRDMSNGYKWLDIKNILIDDYYFIISLCFKEKKLTELSMVLNDKPFDLSSTWGSWTKKDELKKQNEYQIWLKNQIGAIGKFDWGEVWIEYDQKGGSSSIGIRYK